VQTGASLAERAFFADIELTSGVEGTKILDVMPHAQSSAIVLDTVRDRPDAVALAGLQAIIGEPGVRPVNPGAAPLGEDWGMPEDTGQPAGQAVEVRLSAMTGDVRVFRPFRQRAGRWLDFTALPALAPRLVLNAAAAKAFGEYHVPAEMRVTGATHHLTPQFVGVVDDGDSQPRAYARLDELTTWLPDSAVANPDSPGELQVLMTGTTPVEQVLTKKLRAAAIESYPYTVESRSEMEEELNLIRLVFLAMAGLVLLIGVAGILNVGLATVGERVEEFALRRAVGTPRSLLAGIVLAETLLTGLLTAAAAIGVAAAAVPVAAQLLGDRDPLLRDLTFPWEAGVAGIIAGLVAGVLGGLIPAIRAARIPIATVMRA
jgi:FtsX-like permease family